MLGAVKGCVAPGGRRRQGPHHPRSTSIPRSWRPPHCRRCDVVKALKEGNLMVTPGIAYFGDNQLLLDSNLMVEKIEELNDLPIRSTRATSSTCATSATPRTRYAIQTSRVRIDGKQQSLRAHLPPAGRQLAWTWPMASRTAFAAHGETPARRDQAQLRHGSVDLRPRGHPQPDPRGHYRRPPGLDHDPYLPGQLPHDADRQHVDSAGHPRAPSSACTSPATPSTP